MTVLNPAEIFRGQFTKSRPVTFGSIRWPEIALFLLSLLPGALMLLLNVSTIAVGAVLTATSIITGLTFTMAMRFWERRIDISAAAQTAGYLKRKALVDELGTHLIWTVLVGVASTAWAAFSALVSGSSLAPWATAVCAALLSYQLLMVAEALLKLYTSSIELGQ
jgi:branched-subunit amino acid transport protein AzlD